MKKIIKLDTYTFGSSPACIYLVDLINNNQIKFYKKLHSNHQQLNKIIGEIYNSFTNNNLSLSTTSHLLELKRDWVIKNSAELKKAKLETTHEDNKNIIDNVLNVYTNVMLSEINKMRREIKFYIKSTKASIQQSRDKAKNTGSTSGVFQCFGTTNQGNQSFETEVTLNQNHTPLIVFKSEFKDHITNETLMSKSEKRRNK